MNLVNPVNFAEFAASLRRWPDVEAENLHAHDAADALLLAQAAQHDVVQAGHGSRVSVLGDRYGALTLALSAASPAGLGLAGVRVWQDLASSTRALEANAERLGVRGFSCYPEPGSHQAGYGAETLAGAGLVLARLPKNLAELDEMAAAVAAHAGPEVVLIAAGMVKHMTRAMNEVLERHFHSVQASLASRKARALICSGPRTTAAASSDAGQPQVQHDAGLELDVAAYGAAFAGSKVDIGTRFLAGFLEQIPQGQMSGRTILDLGCGTGVLATLAARRWPEAHVLASDVSAAAVASARATAQLNGVGQQLQVFRADALHGYTGEPVDLILLNPPFHLGHSIHAGAAHRLFEAAARVLAPGGEVWAVWNRHLNYRPALERIIGPSTVLGSNPKFVVTRSIKS